MLKLLLLLEMSCVRFKPGVIGAGDCERRQALLASSPSFSAAVLDFLFVMMVSFGVVRIVYARDDKSVRAQGAHVVEGAQLPPHGSHAKYLQGAARKHAHHINL